jgi:RimJ/RimL family protein N-acetyltransferase
VSHLFGKRIRLRAAERTDLATFCRWINDPEVTENLSLIFPMSQVEEEQWYENMLKQPPSNHVMVIDIQTENQPATWQAIGNCGFMNFDWRNHSAELGILIGEKQHWDKGYGTETMHILLKHGFETLNLHRIWLQVYAKNRRAIRSYEKAGFTHEGSFREAHFQHGKYYDVHLMSVLRGEWQSTNECEDQK